MAGKRIPRRVRINGEWYDVSVGISGTLSLSKFMSPVEYTASEPYLHTSDFYHVYDKNNIKVGEFTIGIKPCYHQCGGCVSDFEIDEVPIDTPISPPSPPSGGGKGPDGCGGCLAVLGLYFAFLLRSNWGGRIGVILGVIFVILGVSSGSSNMPAGNILIMIVVMPLLLGTVGAVIGWIIKKITGR